MDKEIKKKILIFMPTYERDGIIQAWPASVDSFYNLEVPEGYKADRAIGLDNPHGAEGGWKNVLHQYQQAQQRILGDDYDVFVTFEHDMIVPEDGLVKLLETPAPVVYGLYRLRHGAQCVNAFSGGLDIYKSMTYMPNEYEAADQRGWAQVSGIGMGFTLFRREVLERFDFRRSGDNYAPDWAIAEDCIKYDIKQVCRFDVKCGHIENHGLVLYPDERELRMVRKPNKMTVIEKAVK